MFGLFVAGVAFGQVGERFSLRHLSLLSEGAQRMGAGVVKGRLTFQDRTIQVEFTNPSLEKQDEGAWDDAEGKMAIKC